MEVLFIRVHDLVKTTCLVIRNIFVLLDIKENALNQFYKHSNQLK